jgi:hypothetical protein
LTVLREKKPIYVYGKETRMSDSTKVRNLLACIEREDDVLRCAETAVGNGDLVSAGSAVKELRIIRDAKFDLGEMAEAESMAWLVERHARLAGLVSR